MRLRYSVHARFQLLEVFSYVNERNAPAAAHVIVTLRASADRLTRSPNLEMKTDDADVRLFIEPGYFYKNLLHRAQSRGDDHSHP